MGIDQIQVPAEQRSYGYTGNNGSINTPHISQLASEGLMHLRLLRPAGYSERASGRRHRPSMQSMSPT